MTKYFKALSAAIHCNLPTGISQQEPVPRGQQHPLAETGQLPGPAQQRPSASPHASTSAK